MKRIRRSLSLLLVLLLVVATMLPTVFAATRSYYYEYDFTLATSGDTEYNGKDENALWYPSDGAATWTVSVDSSSSTYVSSAYLYYIRSLRGDVKVTSLSTISAGKSSSASITASGDYTYYAIINAKTTAGASGTTSLSQ